MYEAGTNKTAVALPPTIVPTAGQVPHMLVSGNLFSLSLTHVVYGFTDWLLGGVRMGRGGIRGWIGVALLDVDSASSAFFNAHFIAAML